MRSCSKAVCEHDKEASIAYALGRREDMNTEVLALLHGDMSLLEVCSCIYICIYIVHFTLVVCVGIFPTLLFLHCVHNLHYNYVNCMFIMSSFTNTVPYVTMYYVIYCNNVLFYIYSTSPLLLHLSLM
jgi:hypothetical protein